MKGLLIKDFLNLKGLARIGLMLAAVFVLSAVVSGSTLSLFSFVIMMLAVLPMSSAGVDEQSQWPAYAQAMPVFRWQMVLSKYLMTLIMLAAAILFMLATTAVAALRAPTAWDGFWQTLLFSGCGVITIVSLTMPFLLWFGVEKARMIIMLVMMAATVLLTLLLPGAAVSFSPPLALLPLAAVVLFALSYLISVRLYEKKEF